MTDYRDRLRKLLPAGYYELNKRGNTMTEEQKVFVPEPAAPCQTCIEHARHRDAEFGIVWCSHVRYGGLYQVDVGLWSLIGPFEDELCFRRALYNILASKMAARPTIQ